MNRQREDNKLLEWIGGKMCKGWRAKKDREEALGSWRQREALWGLGEDEKKLLMSELDQAWAHYRHLEETRTKYLNFFFTILLGSAAFWGTVLRRENLEPNAVIFGFYVYAFFLFVVIAVIYAAINKIGVTRDQYEGIMHTTHECLFRANEGAVGLYKITEKHPGMKIKMYSVQLSAEWLSLVCCVALLGIEWYGSCCQKGFYGLQRGVVLVMASVISLWFIWLVRNCVCIRRWEKRQEKREAQKKNAKAEGEESEP
jgi:hypothetical protein